MLRKREQECERKIVKERERERERGREREKEREGEREREREIGTVLKFLSCSLAVKWFSSKKIHPSSLSFFLSFSF